MASSRIQGITIEIGGDTKPLQKSLQGVNSSIAKTQTELRDVNKLLKLDPRNVELLGQKQKLLAQAVNDTKEKLKTLKTAADQANKALADGKISIQQYQALKREVVATEQALKGLEAQSKKANNQISKSGQLSAKLQAGRDKISAVQDAVQPVAVAATAISAGSVKLAADYEQALANVQATMGLTKASMSSLNGETVNTMDALSKLARKMGAETTFSAKEAADAINYLALAGYDTQKIYDTLPHVLTLAQAGGMDLAKASDMVTDAMSALGLEAKDSAKFVDQMAKTAQSSNTSVEQLGSAILTVGGTAKTLAGGTTEMNTVLGILANNGDKAAEGGTHLRNVILALSAPSDTASKALAGLGVSAYDSDGKFKPLNQTFMELKASLDNLSMADQKQALKDIFNVTDLKSVESLLANTGEAWDALGQKIQSSQGAGIAMAKTQNATLKGQLKELGSASEEAAIAIGDSLKPIVSALVSALKGLVSAFNSLPGPMKTVIGLVVGFVGVAGTVGLTLLDVVAKIGMLTLAFPTLGASLAGVATTITSTVIPAVWAFTTALLANPITWVIALAIALGVAIGALVANFDEVKIAVGNMWNGLEESMNKPMEVVKKLINDAKTWGADLVKGIAEGIDSAIDAVENAVTKVANAIKSRLHFSRPDEGPLREYEKWMPDFMKGLARGINESKYLVSNAMNGLASDMVISPNATINGSNGGTINLTQPLTIDGKELTKVVTQIQYSNGRASLRNMGRS